MKNDDNSKNVSTSTLKYARNYFTTCLERDSVNIFGYFTIFTENPTRTLLTIPRCNHTRNLKTEVKLFFTLLYSDFKEYKCSAKNCL